MKVETEKILAKNIATTIKMIYCDGNHTWRKMPGQEEDTETIYKALVAMGPDPDPEKAKELIPNPGWIQLDSCDECGDRPDVIIEIGFSDYNDPTYLCMGCIDKAKNLMMEEYNKL